MSLNERSQSLLMALVQRYIREGAPVASKALAADLPVPMSPATVRNVMSDLEELGYLASPHTSAGRIPTEQGYRFFVDTCITASPVNDNSTPPVVVLNPDLPSRDLIQRASGMLSTLTHYAGLVMVPRVEEVRLRLVEFLPLSGDRVLVILVLNEKEVQNRIIHTGRVYSEQELQQAAAYITANYCGMTLEQMREGILKAMAGDKTTINQLMSAMIDVASETQREITGEGDYVLSGEANLLQNAGADNLDELKSLFEAFEAKQGIIHLLDNCIQNEGVQIFIGAESGNDALVDYSLITAPYESGGGRVGVLGVVGPKRMAYDEVIPVVDITARLLSNALSRGD